MNQAHLFKEKLILLKYNIWLNFYAPEVRTHNAGHWDSLSHNSFSNTCVACVSFGLGLLALVDKSNLVFQARMMSFTTLLTNTTYYLNNSHVGVGDGRSYETQIPEYLSIRMVF
jgi:hypothetical protein